MMRGRMGRFLASLLAVSMVMQLVPTVAFGADEMVLDVPVMEEEMEMVELLELEEMMEFEEFAEFEELEEVEEVEELEELDAELMEEVAELSATSGSCGSNATWEYDSSTYTLTISGTGDMTNYTSSSSMPWYSYRSSIKTVIIAEGVTSIGDYAFVSCSKVTSITIPEGVTSIGECAFRATSNLTCIDIPDSVTSIGVCAFLENFLSSIDIPEGVTSIGVCAFANSYALSSVRIYNKDVEFGEGVFSYCLRKPTLYGYAGSTTETYASENSLSFVEISSSDGVTWTYNDSTYTLTISGSGDMEDYIDSSDAPWYRYISNIKTVIIAEGVTSIGDYEFNGCSSLESVEISNSVLSIGDYAFNGCSSLESIEIPNSVLSIGDYAFNGCSSLESVEISNSVLSIGEAAFNWCSSLESVEIPNSVESIGDYAFWQCGKLTSVKISDSVSSIGKSVFATCEILESITVDENNLYYSSQDGVLFNEDKTQIISYPAGKTNTTYTMPDSVESIEDYAFKYCTSLESIELPDSLKSIGDSAFSSCASLESIEIPDSLESIGDYAFIYCASLKNIELPDSVTGIGYYGVFAYCTNLQSVKMPNSVESIGEQAFFACTNLESVEMPDSVTSIGFYAFAHCESLTGIELPDSVESIEQAAFYNCNSLASITIPAGVTSIGYGAFSDCSSLTDVYYAGSEAEWNAISIDEYNEYLTTATIHYNWVIEDTPDATTGFQLISTNIVDEIITEEEDELILTFSENLKGYNWDWLDNKRVYIKNAETDEVVLEFDSVTFASYYCTISDNVLTIPFWGTLSSNVTYYLEIDAGLISSEDGEDFAGVTKADGIYFRMGYDFQLEVDSNNFVHGSSKSSYGFYGVTDYTISDEAYNNLTEGLSSAQVSPITSAINNTWGGSCYGISASMGLVASGSIALSDISSSSADSYFELPLPWKNTQLLDSINYYQLSQYIVSPTEFEYIGSCSVVLRSLIASLNAGEVSVFCYGYYSDGKAVGHAILATDVAVNTNGGYTVTLYDMNSVGTTTSGKFTTMTVSSDYKTFSFYSPKDVLMNNDSCRWLKHVDLDEFDFVQEPYDAQLSSAEQTLILSGTDFYVSNENNETISIDADGTLSIDMDDATVTNIIAYETADGDSSASQILISVPISDGYEITSEGAYFEMQLVGTDEYLAIEGEDVATVTMDLDDGITVSGEEDEYTFTASILASDSDEEVNLVAISATATADTMISEDASTSTITAVSDAALTDTSMVSMTGVTKTDLLDQKDEDDTVISVNTGSGEAAIGEIINLSNISISNNKVTFKVEVVDTTVNVAELQTALALYNTNGQMVSLNTEGIEEGENTISIDSTLNYEAAKLLTMDANNKPILTAIELPTE